jgi:tetratricopeptide (TPR) repeat protein
MRRLFLAATLALGAGAALAEITSVETCRAAIAADPGSAREDAALWTRSGGGIPARLCEAAALEALGATATAARMLTELGEDTARSMPADLRATILTDAARLWLEAGQPGIAAEALARADTLTPPDPERRLLAARTAAALGDWASALTELDAALAADPADARARALRAAALRNKGAPAEALAEAETALAASPDLPEALFEAGAANAELGAPDLAAAYWLMLTERHPEHSLADLARRNLANAAAPPPPDAVTPPPPPSRDTAPAAPRPMPRPR